MGGQLKETNYIESHTFQVFGADLFYLYLRIVTDHHATIWNPIVLPNQILIFLVFALKRQWPTATSASFPISPIKMRCDCEMICRLFLSSNSQHNLKFRHAFSGTKKSIDYHLFLIINKSVCVSIRYGASWLWSPWFSSSRQRPSRPSILILIK